ncbi:hypothetical protein [Streptomyces sp. NPDC001546]|uniref:hypothetical protein n=1 Tax=Streptomyces sp. NPDC001546 TaxID=3364585 RepID=UPI003689FE51
MDSDRRPDNLAGRQGLVNLNNLDVLHDVGTVVGGVLEAGVGGTITQKVFDAALKIKHQQPAS